MSPVRNDTRFAGKVNRYFVAGVYKNGSRVYYVPGYYMEHIFLLPGEYRISKQPEVVETLVGSCVTVCLYNKKTGHAAMNHFLQDRPASETGCDIGRYGTTATEYIINTLMKLDPEPGHYRAQIFGGANVVKTTSDKASIGQVNSDTARKLLVDHRIRIIREEVGGARGRRVRFDTSTNTVFCRFAGQPGKKYCEPSAS